MTKFSISAEDYNEIVRLGKIFAGTAGCRESKAAAWKESYMAKIITATVHIEVKDSVAYECFEKAQSIGRALFDNYTDLEF